MNDWRVRLALALLVPAMFYTWKTSRLVALAIAIPFVANVVELLGATSLSDEHPARVVVPLVSALLGFVAAMRDDVAEFPGTVPFQLGCVTAGLGIVDALAPKYFAISSAWYPVWMNAVACVAFIVISERKVLCSTSSSP